MYGSRVAQAPRGFRWWLLALVACVLLAGGFCKQRARGVAPPRVQLEQAAPARDAYTGFVIGPKASVDTAGRFWLAGFVFRTTREKRYLGDVAVAAMDVQCSYAADEFQALFREPGSLVTFKAAQGPDGNLELTSCPADATGLGNFAVGPAGGAT